VVTGATDESSPARHQPARHKNACSFSAATSIARNAKTLARASFARLACGLASPSPAMGKGYKGVNPKGGKGGKGGGRGDAAAPPGQLKQKWRKGQDEDDSSSEEEASGDERASGGSSEEEEEAAAAAPKPPRRPAPGALPPNSSDEDESGSESESDDDDDDPLLNPNAAPRTRRPASPPLEKSKKEMEAEMEKLKLVRERRAKEAAERIAREGYDRFLPPGAPGGPPKVED